MVSSPVRAGSEAHTTPGSSSSLTRGHPPIPLLPPAGPALTKTRSGWCMLTLGNHPPPCSLHNWRIGLIASLLLAVHTHRLSDALQSDDRINARFPLFCAHPADELWCNSDSKIHENPTITTLHTFHVELALFEHHALTLRTIICDLGYIDFQLKKLLIPIVVLEMRDTTE